ncbi:MAG: HYExAFE family protein [Pirellulales bacterium]|nr:HYExAFE family protein [Pirellulales bacterium]
MLRRNHYEAAFEAYLQAQCAPYVAVNEQRRSVSPWGSLKSVDFVVTPAEGRMLLVDVKGRRFPSGVRSPQYWRNWSTWDDLRSMARWQDQFGPGALAVLAFAYEVIRERSPLPVDELFWFRDRRYAMLAVPVADYVRFARTLSPKWQTVAMPTARFRESAAPFAALLPLGTPAGGN